MDGKGYPRQLLGSQMSIPARIMAIADIFEALTASDRPYKSGKTVSQSLAIMQSMVREQHIDPALFALFVSSGIWRDYAERFLAPSSWIRWMKPPCWPRWLGRVIFSYICGLA